MTPYDEELAAAGLDPAAVRAQVLEALAEDLPGGDVTSIATIAEDAQGVGVFAAREAGVVAGLGVAALVFHEVMGDTVTVSDRLPDGTRVAPGDVVMRVAGPTRGLLTAERTALNYASHLSGVATATSHWVDALAGTHARVLDTRKTLPTYRALQKYAVRCGGGVNHRFSLSDRAMVKDNHVVAAGSVTAAVAAVREAFPDVLVQVEADTLDQALEAVAAGATFLLLDNMPTDVLAATVAAVRAGEATTGRIELEATGNLTLDRAAEVARTGVDYMSVGGLTHSAPILDLALDLVAR